MPSLKCFRGIVALTPDRTVHRPRRDDGYVGSLCERPELEWLVEAINAGLDALRQRLVGLSRFTIELRAFERAPLDQMAIAIATGHDAPYSLKASSS